MISSSSSRNNLFVLNNSSLLVGIFAQKISIFLQQLQRNEKCDLLCLWKSLLVALDILTYVVWVSFFWDNLDTDDLSLVFSTMKDFGWVLSIYLTFLLRDTQSRILLSLTLVKCLSNQLTFCLNISTICTLLISLMVELLLIHLASFFLRIPQLNRRWWPKGGVIWYLS